MEHLHVSSLKEKVTSCLELQIFLLHSMFDTEQQSQLDALLLNGKITLHGNEKNINES